MSSNDSDAISDIEDEEISKLSQEVEQNVISNDFKEKIIKYIKIDDLIRIKQEEIKELKSQKEPCETYILRYLDTMEQTFVDIQGKGKLIKNQSESKAPLKLDMIKDAIKEGISNEKLVADDVKCAQILDNICYLM
jgi:hypothetical protein